VTSGDALLDRIRADGGAAVVAPAERGTPDAAFVVGRIRTAMALPPEDAARIVAVWDEAGARHDPETLDAALTELTAGGWVPFVGAHGRRRLRESALAALAATQRAGTVELAAAVLGAAGKKEDAEILEALGHHPAFTLHAATALSNLAHWQGRAALLRLLTTTQGDSRVLVIDRLLPHVREPAVRLALVRDALTGLSPEHAREVAADIAALCTVQDCIDDPDAPADLKAGARAVLAACPPRAAGE
jgi:hypothetical protein